MRGKFEMASPPSAIEKPGGRSWSPYSPGMNSVLPPCEAPGVQRPETEARKEPVTLEHATVPRKIPGNGRGHRVQVKDVFLRKVMSQRGFES